MPSVNFTPWISFGNWLCQSRRRAIPPYAKLSGGNSGGNSGRETATMLPKVEADAFGILIDGELVKMLGVASVAEAERLVAGLVGKGRKIEIVDKATGQIVKCLSPRIP